MNSIESLIALGLDALTPGQLDAADLPGLKLAADTACAEAMNTPARNLADAARQMISRHLFAVGANEASPSLNRAAERARGKRDQARTLIAAARHFRAIRDASHKPANLWPHLSNLPSPEPAPIFVPLGTPFDIAGWISERADTLLDSRRIRLDDNKILARGFDTADMDVLRRYERTVAGWVREQFTPVESVFAPVPGFSPAA